MSGHQPFKVRESKAQSLRLEDWPMSRDEALMNGKAYYVGPKPCRMGHMWLRRTDSRACVMCTELARGCNELRVSAGRPLGNAVAEYLRGVFERSGSRALSVAQQPFVELLSMMQAGIDPAVVKAALANAPIQTDDGVLWALTAAGRAMGREVVAAMLPGDAMNMKLMERLKVSP